MPYLESYFIYFLLFFSRPTFGIKCTGFFLGWQSISKGEFCTGWWTQAVKPQQPWAHLIAPSLWIYAKWKWDPEPWSECLSGFSITCSSVLFSMSVSMSSVQAKSNKRLRKRLLIEKTGDFRGINITVRFHLPPLLFNWAFCFNLQTATQIGAFKGRSGSGEENMPGAPWTRAETPGWRPSLSSVTSLLLLLFPLLCKLGIPECF